MDSLEWQWNWQRRAKRIDNNNTYNYNNTSSRRCPKCKSIRWNQRYLDEELALINRLQDELYETGLIRESGEKIVYEENKTLGIKARTVYPYDYDFISYDFLKQILPQPELFELRQVLAIPKIDIEARHDYMLSVIKDRADNADVYEREYFSKYPNYELLFQYL